jgi:hypothetical protein
VAPAFTGCSGYVGTADTGADEGVVELDGCVVALLVSAAVLAVDEAVFDGDGDVDEVVDVMVDGVVVVGVDGVVWGGVGGVGGGQSSTDGSSTNGFSTLATITTDRI